MILKEFQKNALSQVREFLERLTEWRLKAAKAHETVPDLAIDWVGKAWEKAVPHHSYLPRKNGLGEPLPAFCLKVPTGGGKTLLATKVIDLVHTRYRRRQNGLVLWIVPSTQIYSQTLKALRDRDHPYRQQLDVASAGRTLVLEKNSGFGPQDVRERLCVLLLMLPSANRETKEQLRMFRDSGGFDRFFPADDDAPRSRAAVGGSPQSGRFRFRRRRLGSAGQDFAGQHAAPAAAAHHSGRRPQGVQPQRQEDARRLQPRHDRGAFRYAAAGGERAGGHFRPSAERGGDDQAGPAHSEQSQRQLAGYASGRHRASPSLGGRGASARSGDGHLHSPHLLGAGGAHRKGSAPSRVHSRGGRA